MTYHIFQYKRLDLKTEKLQLRSILVWCAFSDGQNSFFFGQSLKTQKSKLNEITILESFFSNPSKKIKILVLTSTFEFFGCFVKID